MGFAFSGLRAIPAHMKVVEAAFDIDGVQQRIVRAELRIWNWDRKRVVYGLR